jgi:hypothetical protein
MPDWFAIHFRNGKSVLVEGEAARDRAMSRKVPAAVEWSTPVIHRCTACGSRGPWQTIHWDRELSGPRGWCWVGTADNARRGRKVEKFCSHQCRKTRWPEYPAWDLDLPVEERITLQSWEPVPDAKAWQSWSARREREQEFKAHRRFEMPVHENHGTGWCRWCGIELLERAGKNKGKRSKRRTWCRWHQGDDRDCYREYLLHTDHGAQYWFLVERDGPGCADCGIGEGRWVPSTEFASITYIRWSVKLEVDHETALWLIPYLPPEKPAWRRALFSPDNLKLRCPPAISGKARAKRLTVRGAATSGASMAADLARRGLDGEPAAPLALPTIELFLEFPEGPAIRQKLVEFLGPPCDPAATRPRVATWRAASDHDMGRVSDCLVERHIIAVATNESWVWHPRNMNRTRAGVDTADRSRIMPS